MEGTECLQFSSILERKTKNIAKKLTFPQKLIP